MGGWAGKVYCWTWEMVVHSVISVVDRSLGMHLGAREIYNALSSLD